MKNSIYFLLLLLATLLTNCTSSKAYTTPESRLQNQYYSATDPITESLFSSPNSTISEENIQKILDGEIELPTKVRLAVLQLDGYRTNRYWYASEAYRTQQASYFSTISQAAAASGRTDWISLLPTMLTSAEKNVFTLRESAVRMQADVLLIYSVNSDIYSEFKLFKKDEAKAFANVEAMLLDIRTGVIVFTETLDAEASGTRTEEDTGQDDFYRRLRFEASQLAVEEMSKRLSAFLTI